MTKIENRITDYGTKKSVNNLVIAHETANSTSTIDSEVNYMKNNWRSAFVTHFVGGGGRIIQTAPVGKVSWGAGAKANPYSYAQVELCRANNKATFEKDYKAYVTLLRDLANQAGIPKTLDTGSSVSNKGIKTHLWVTQKLGGTNHTDPYGYLASWGITKAQFDKDIRNGISGAVTITKPGSSQAPVPVNTNAKLIEDGYIGKATIAKLQKAMGTPVDGVLSEPSQVIKVMQTKLGVKADGWLGKDTITALQRRLGTPVDGVLSQPSNVIKEMQKQLNAGNFLSTPTATANKKTIKVGKQAKQWADGKNISSWVIGQNFEVQKEISITKSRSKKAYRLLNKGIVIGDLLEQDVDGVVANTTAPKPQPAKPQPGDAVIKGIQANTGTAQDGFDGPNTRKGVIKLFQRGVGTTDDGIVGNNTLNKAPVIRSGSQGWHVYAVQAMLYLKGYKSVGKPDKIWGNNSIQACKNFQKDNGLSADGTPGRATYAKLIK